MRNLFTFCEHSFATSRSKWHIRRLTDTGKKLSGGADTASLCGKEVSWDLESDVTPMKLTGDRICPQCRMAYLASNPPIL